MQEEKSDIGYNNKYTRKGKAMQGVFDEMDKYKVKEDK